MESATILTNLTGIPSGPVDVSDLNNFSTRWTSPWDTSRSLKLAGLSSGRDSISSSRQKGKSLLTGNEHFANISSSVQLNHASDPPNWERIAYYVDSKLPSGVSYCIPPISENFVRTSLQQLSTNKATGLDDLSSYFLKIAASSISPSLTAIFNLSISSGVFPDLWKTTKVSPLHKDCSLFDRSNYRPISVLAIVSKILERHVHQTFYHFLSQHDLLLDSQFGFHSFRSCELAIADLSDNILTNMDNKLT